MNQLDRLLSRRSFKRWLALLIGVPLFLAACGGGDGDDGPVASTVRSADGVLTLTIPAGALTEDVDIVITRLDPATLPFDVPAGVTAIGFDLSPDGLQFALPITVEFRITDHGLNLDDGIPLAIVFSRSSDGAISPYGNPQLSADGDVLLITGQIEHFTEEWAEVTGEVRYFLVPSPITVIRDQNEIIFIDEPTADLISGSSIPLGAIAWSATAPFTFNPIRSRDTFISCTSATDGEIEDAISASAAFGEVPTAAIARIFGGVFNAGVALRDSRRVPAELFLARLTLSANGTCIEPASEDEDGDDGETSGDPEAGDSDGDDADATSERRSSGNPGNEHVVTGDTVEIVSPSFDCFEQEGLADECPGSVDLVRISFDLDETGDLINSLIEFREAVALNADSSTFYGITIRGGPTDQVPPGGIGITLAASGGNPLECSIFVNGERPSLGEDEFCGVEDGDIVFQLHLPDLPPGPLEFTVITGQELESGTVEDLIRIFWDTLR